MPAFFFCIHNAGMKNITQHEIATKEKSNVVIGIASELYSQGDMVQIFPAKEEWFGADGRGPYRLKDPSGVANKSKEAQLIKFSMIDRDHARQLAPEGTPVRAAGWFTDFEAREDGSIWGRVDWTPKGKQEVSDKEYRYFSATFAIDRTTREILYITGGTVTNSPNFQDMQAIASKTKTNSHEIKENDPMKPELIALAASLGLDPKETTEAQILAAAKKIADENAEIQTGLASVKQAFKLKVDADISSVVNAAETAAQESVTASKKVDPEQYVPKVAYDELASRMDSLEKQTTQNTVSEVVAAAMKEGKISPNMKSWAEEYAAQNLEGFKDFVEKAAPILTGETAASKQKGSENGSLSNEDIEVAKQLGIDPETLKKKEDAAE